MKKLLLLLAFLLATAISYSQCSNYKRYSQCSYKEYSVLHLSVNYGIENTLGAELLYQNGNDFIGVGYAGFIGSTSNTKYLSIDKNQYHVKNEALYLTYGRQIDKWVFTIKYGIQNNADWNKKVFPTGSYTYEKDANVYTTMMGGSLGYCLTNRFRLNLGVDSFSQTTLGFTVGL